MAGWAQGGRSCYDIQVVATHALVRLWQQLDYLIDVCRVTRGAHIEHFQLSKKENFFSFPVTVNNSIKVGPFGFLVINVCNHGEHYETPCIIYYP